MARRVEGLRAGKTGTCFRNASRSSACRLRSRLFSLASRCASARAPWPAPSRSSRISRSLARYRSSSSNARFSRTWGGRRGTEHRRGRSKTRAPAMGWKKGLFGPARRWASCKATGRRFRREERSRARQCHFCSDIRHHSRACSRLGPVGVGGCGKAEGRERARRSALGARSAAVRLGALATGCYYGCRHGWPVFPPATGARTSLLFCSDVAARVLLLASSVSLRSAACAQQPSGGRLKWNRGRGLGGGPWVSEAQVRGKQRQEEGFASCGCTRDLLIEAATRLPGTRPQGATRPHPQSSPHTHRWHPHEHATVTSCVQRRALPPAPA